MAALAKSAVTLLSERSYGPNEYFPQGLGAKGFVTRRLVLVLTGQGGATNTIGAAALGFTRLLECSNIWDNAANEVKMATVNPLTNVILVCQDALAPTSPGDLTSTAAYITVTGTAALPAV